MRTRCRRGTGRGTRPGAALFALGVLGATLVTSAAEASPHSATAPAPAQATTIELLSQPPWHRLGETVLLRVAVDGAPAGATVEIERHDDIGSRSELAGSDADDELGSPEHTTARVPLASLPPGPDGAVELGYSLPEDAGLDQFGVYPLQVLVADADGSTLTRLVTHLVILPEAGADTFPPLEVALLMEIGGPNGLQPDGTVAITPETQDAIADRIQILQRTRLPVSVAPSPEMIHALDQMGGRGPLLVNQLRAALSGREPLARPYVDVDLDALVAANLLTQLPPEAEAGAQVVRTRFEVDPLGGTWLTGPTLGGPAARALVDVATPRAIVPTTAVASVPDLDDGEVPTEPVRLSEAGPLAFVSDDALATRLTGGEGALDAHRFLAELAFIWMTRPAIERGVVVRIPEDAALDVETVVAALDGMAGDDGAVRVVSTQELFENLGPGGPGAGDGDGDEGEDEPPVVELAPYEPTSDLRPLVDPLGQAQAKVRALAGTVGDQELIGSLQRSLLISLGADTDDDDRGDYIRRVDDVVRVLADQVSAPAEFQITLTAREGTIPLTLTNDSGRPIDVKVHLSSNQLEFPSGSTITRTLEPGPTRLDLDVRTRTSGAFPLDIRITSPDDEITLDETTFRIRSTAVSGAGLFLSAGAGLFLLIWWARHWRTAKRSQRLVDESRPLA